MLSGKSVLITGAGSGIGRALTLALAQEEASLHLVGRNEAALAELARRARSWGAEARTYTLELTDDGAVRAFAGAFSVPLDILVHSAGMVALGTVKDADIDDFDAQYRLNVRAPYLLTQLFLGRLEQVKGQVVFLNSGAGLTARANWSAYAASKHALKAVADSLRDELRGTGVRVLSVYPGRTASPMQASVHKQEGKPYDPAKFVQPEDVAATIVSALSLPPTAEVTDVSVRPPG
ncbi:MAG: L-fuco-beta-pyranose dehydrogenase [uncultured Truepera sp.]|uniref:L-fuco-beta-pyranose dehydrogenase n=1 Tax=uncultured Truepera sp. TaxID=543023 RepID=A0A6J4VSA6_9DEIN|nr:MAG: L-fuco-beta-pyranose dehydrogenase [uncultured Truepera sp.]